MSSVKLPSQPLNLHLIQCFKKSVPTLTKEETLILQHAEDDIHTILTNHHLKIKSGSELIIWNNVYKCYEYEAAIEGANLPYAELKREAYYSSSIRIQPCLENRTIRVRILTNSASTTQNSHDYVNRLESLENTAIDLVKQAFDKEKMPKEINYSIQEIQKIRIFVENILRTINPNQNHKVALKYLQAFNSSVADILEKLKIQCAKDDEVLENLEEALGPTHLGYIESATDIRCKMPMPRNPKEWLKILEAHEARFTAIQTKRNIIFNIYKNRNAQSIWTMNSNIPFSDVPSTLRNSTGQILPNWFRSHTKMLKISADQAILVDDFTAERSSSITPIANSKKIKNKNAKRIARNKLRLLVRNQILEKLNHFSSTELEQLDSCFQPELLVMTLLSLSVFASPGTEYEPVQYQEGRRAFVFKRPIKLADSDIQYILDHGPSLNVIQKNKLKDYLLNKEIHHKAIFHNFATNVIRYVSNEYTYNKAAGKVMQQWMLEYFRRKTGINLDQINNVKQLMDLYEEITDPEVKQTLSYYIVYLKLLSKKFVAKDLNYFQPLFTALLAKRLGKEIHITCKSGEDRTGAMFVAIDCALGSFARINPNNDVLPIHKRHAWKKFKEDFWQHYAETEDLSISREITDMNARGARGLQSLDSRLIFPEKIYKKFSLSNKMAKIAKGAFSRYKNKKERDRLFQKFNVNNEDNKGIALSQKKQDIILFGKKSKSCQPKIKLKSTNTIAVSTTQNLVDAKERLKKAMELFNRNHPKQKLSWQVSYDDEGRRVYVRTSERREPVLIVTKSNEKVEYQFNETPFISSNAAKVTLYACESPVEVSSENLQDMEVLSYETILINKVTAEPKKKLKLIFSLKTIEFLKLNQDKLEKYPNLKMLLEKEIKRNRIDNFFKS